MKFGTKEYWYAMELSKVLEYNDRKNFLKILNKAVLSANNSVSNEEDWLADFNKPIKTGKGKKRLLKIINYQDIYVI